MTDIFSLIVSIFNELGYRMAYNELDILCVLLGVSITTALLSKFFALVRGK